MMDLAISIIIPTYGGASFTRSCLESLHRHTAGASIEILLVDDASSDADTLAFLDEISNDDRIRLFRQEANGGFSKACNRGIAEARAPLVLLLNNDTEVLDGWLTPLLKAFEDPKVGAAGSLLLYPEQVVIQHAGIELRREGSTLKPFHIGQYQRASFARWCQEDRLVQAVTGACLAFRKNALPGGTFLDEDFRNGYEDVDLCLRLREAGWSIRYCGHSMVVHHESVTINRFRGEDANLRIFQRKWQHIGDSQPPDIAERSLRELRARRNYLQKPDPQHAAKVLCSLDIQIRRQEFRYWELLARGRYFPHRRLSAEARAEIHRLLGIDRLQIRHR